MLTDKPTDPITSPPLATRPTPNILPPSEALALLNSAAAKHPPQTDTPHIHAGGESVEPVSLAVATETTQLYFGLQLGGLGLLLNDAIEKEIVNAFEVCEIPGSPRWFKGFFNLRSQVVPVFDLYDYLNLDRESSLFKSDYLLVIGQGDAVFALTVALLPQKIRISPQHQIDERPPYPEPLRRFCATSYRRNGLWCEWDVAGFIEYISRDFHA